ncbi:MAG: aminoacyl--tRNA ligase-related protein [Gammaproteobacteria bacterium]
MPYLNQYGALGLRQSELVSKAVKTAPAEEDSMNARLLIRAGFVRKLMAGAYSYLPLGFRVLQKVEAIIREEMSRIGSHEILMPALQPAEGWQQTGRWDTMADILFKLKGAGERDLTLGPTHEEIVTPLIGAFVNSYRDLPVSVFQIQTKFRNEPRAKSGLLRGREFRMKDMYSFHASEADLDTYYKTAQQAYEKVFRRCGLGDITYLTYASGGAFSKYSHEYQTLSPHGEDLIYVCEDCNIAVNKEISEDLDQACPSCGKTGLRQETAIEVGNIFKLMTRFSDAFGLSFQDEYGVRQDKIYMGCYGIGSSRLVGAIVDASHDGNGIIWPASVAPYAVHLVSLARTDEEKGRADDVYQVLQESSVEVLYDDREKISAGAKLSESDLIGIPVRMVVSPRSLKTGSVEVKDRKTPNIENIAIHTLPEVCRMRFNNHSKNRAS